MPSSFTENYNLNQWVKSDKVQMEDFNADNEKIDTVLSGLSAAVTEHTSQITKLGNCQIYYTTYVGTGSAGANGPCTLTFPGKPLVVFIGVATGSLRTMMAIQGMQYAFVRASGAAENNLTWEGNSLSWFHRNAMADSQMNEQGRIHAVICLMAADEED